jgi:protein ImuA
MSNRRLDQARAALRRAEKQWKGSLANPSGGTDRVIRHAFGIDLAPYFSLGGLMPVGLHEVMTAHDDGAASALACALARLRAANIASPAKPGTVLWIRQRRAIDQGTLYTPAILGDMHRPDWHAPLSEDQKSTPHPKDLGDLVMMNVDQPQSALWACEEAAKSGQVPTVIVEITGYDLTAARRLQLACEAGGARLIALRRWHPGHGIAPSPAWSRWRIEGLPARTGGRGFERGNDRNLNLIGGRGVRPGRWRVSLDDATLSLSVADALENRLPSFGQHRQRVCA